MAGLLDAVIDKEAGLSLLHRELMGSYVVSHGNEVGLAVTAVARAVHATELGGVWVPGLCVCAYPPLQLLVGFWAACGVPNLAWSLPLSLEYRRLAC